MYLKECIPKGLQFGYYLLPRHRILEFQREGEDLQHLAQMLRERWLLMIRAYEHWHVVFVGFGTFSKKNDKPQLNGNHLLSMRKIGIKT
jgi:hypothetical protein